MSWSRRFLDPIKFAGLLLAVLSALATLVAFGISYLSLSKQDAFFLFGLGMLLLVIFQLRHLTNQITTSFDELPGRLRDAITSKGGSLPVNSKPSGDGPQELKPSGSGAFGGMVVGAGVGLALGGPVGVLIGGIIGALVGNQIEYEDIQKKRPPKS